MDATALVAAGIMLAGGVVSVPLGGAMVVVIPSFIMLGIEPASALLLALLGIYGTNLGAGTTFIRLGGISWRHIGWLAPSTLLGAVLGAQVAVNLPIEQLSVMVIVVVLLGAILLVRKPQIPQLPRTLGTPSVFVSNAVCSAYGALGGSGHNQLMAVIMQAAWGWELKKSLAHRRTVGMLVLWLTPLIFWLSGVAVTGYEIPVFIAGAVGGWLGAHATWLAKETWLRWLLLGFAICSLLRLLMFYI